MSIQKASISDIEKKENLCFSIFTSKENLIQYIQIEEIDWQDIVSLCENSKGIHLVFYSLKKKNKKFPFSNKIIESLFSETE